MIAISENTSLVFRLHLALFRLVGLSKRKIIEPSLTALTGFPFALVFTWTFSECATLRWPTTVTAKANQSRQKQITRGKLKQIAHGKSKSLTAKTNSLTAKANQLRMRYFYSGGHSSQLRASVSLTDCFP